MKCPVAFVSSENCFLSLSCRKPDYCVSILDNMFIGNGVDKSRRMSQSRNGTSNPKATSSRSFACVCIGFGRVKIKHTIEILIADARHREFLDFIAKRGNALE